MNSMTRELLLCSVTVFLLLECVGQVTGGEDADQQMSNYKKLKDKLLKDYDKTVRPVAHHTNNTNVTFGLLPLYILDLNEEKSLFSLDSWLVLTWHDDRLKWEESEYDGLSYLPLADDSVWQPDIVVYNSHSGTIDPKKNVHLLVYSNGEVWYEPPAVLDTYCPMVFEGRYPKDSIVCEIQFGSWAHNGWQMDLHTFSKSVFLDEFSNTNPRWELQMEQVKMQRAVMKYNCCEEIYVSLLASFPLSRRPPQELEVVWAPCILVMSLTLTMFWIPSASTKKITLGSGLMLVLAVFCVYVGAMTKSPHSARTAVSFLESTMYAVSSAFLIEVFIINLARFAGPKRPPPAIIELLSGPIGKYICVWASWKETIPGDKIQLKEEVEHVSNEPSANDEWILLATAMDRVLFFIYIIVFAAIHQI